MAQAVKKTREVVTGVTLELTAFEVLCIRAFIGNMTGTGNAKTALSGVYNALYDLNLGEDPLVVTHTPCYMYVKDKK
jgi:hypothetical protein